MKHHQEEGRRAHVYRYRDGWAWDWPNDNRRITESTVPYETATEAQRGLEDAVAAQGWFRATDWTDGLEEYSSASFRRTMK